MAEDAKQEQIKLCTKRKLATMQLKNSATIAHEQQIKISKILTVVACPSVENVEVNNAEAKFGVNVRYDALVCLENGEIVTLSQTGSSTTSCENSSITPDSHIDIFATVLDVSSNITSGEVNVTSLINCDLYISNRNVCVKQIQSLQDVYTKECEVTINSFKTSNSYSSTITSELENQGKISKIIFCNSTGTIKSITPNNDYYTINGQVTINAMCEYEDGQIKSQTQDLPLNEEVECQGLSKDDILQTTFNTKPCSSTIITDAEGNTLVNVEVPYNVSCHVYQKTSRDFVVDAYNIEKELNLTTESYEQNEFLPTKFVEETIISTFTLTDEAPRVERILLSTGESISLVNSYPKNGEIVVEGIANIGTIYYSEDEQGNKVLNSVVIDVPYSLSVLAPEVREGDNVEVEVKLADVSVKNKKGRELEVIANIVVSYSVNRPQVFAIATEINFGETKPNKNYALEIYVAKENQTLWDVAKHLNISTENLLSQNPELNLPISVGDKIVAYHGGTRQ